MNTNRLSNTNTISLQGCLLAADRNWQDPMYSGSVCLIIHHSNQGAIGIFLNRRIGIPIGEFLSKLEGATPGDTKASLHFGGPQAGPVVAIHRRQDLAEFMPSEGVYMAAQVEHLNTLLKSADKGSDVRLIIGQANWAAGELDKQFSEGRWIPLPVTPELVFCDEDRMWADALADAGNRFVLDLVGCHSQPDDLLAN